MPQLEPNNLVVVAEDAAMTITITQEMLEEAKSIFGQIDQDLDNGRQLGRHFIHSPTILQRCQIVGERLLTALHTDNIALRTLMAGYILDRLPGVHTVVLNTDGEAEETLFYDQSNSLIG